MRDAFIFSIFMNISSCSYFSSLKAPWTVENWPAISNVISEGRNMLLSISIAKEQKKNCKNSEDLLMAEMPDGQRVPQHQLVKESPRKAAALGFLLTLASVESIFQRLIVEGMIITNWCSNEALCVTDFFFLFCFWSILF